MAHSSRTHVRTPLLFAAILLLSATPTASAGQAQATVRVAENFRRAPNDVVLARLNPGARIAVVGRDGNWTQADVEGWLWLASLQESDADFDLVVAESEGENLRDAPSGTIIGRVEEGALFDELGREPGWAHVRRRGWIWTASVNAPTATASAPTTAAPGQAAARPAPARQPAPPPPSRLPDGFASVGGADAAILTAPDGDTLAVAKGGRDLQVVSREGNWARIRLDGWVWMPATNETTDGGTPSALVPDELTQDPTAHVGRVVSWNLQFISLESAEEIRTDFRRGEPFLLTRYGGPDGPFVYVAVPQERRTEVEGLVPLERITVTARVRTGASALTGTPIVDLLSLERRP
jgi:hypothetical protein